MTIELNAEKGDMMYFQTRTGVSLTKVMQVLPDGTIVTEHGRFNPDGSQCVKTARCRTLAHMTDAVLAQHKRQVIVRKLRAVRWGNIDIGILEDILETVEMQIKS